MHLSLHDALPILKNGPVIPDNLEEKVLELVHKYNLQERVIFSAFDHRVLEKLYRLDNNIKAAFIFHVNLIDPLKYIDSLDMKAFSIHPNCFYITKEMFKEAHRHDIKVNDYNVDNLNISKHLKS